MAESDFWFWLLTLGVAVVAGGAAALRWLRIARLIEDTPTSRIRSAAQGYVELLGNGLLLPGTNNPAPLTQRPCVWWSYRIAKRTERGTGKNRRESWQTIASGTSSIAFLLDDETGQCIVQPDGAEVVPAESTTWYGDTPWPASGPDRKLSLTGGRGYRYVEDRIYEHERLYALGDFRSTASSGELDQQAELARVLAEWKEDQPALLQRFDRDGDGRIDMVEWEAARQEARRTLTERGAERPTRQTFHVLCRPDGDRLFLLAALPPGDLTRHYRRRAAFAFLGFVAAVYALGWLLQGAFG
ncbi:MAG: GIDE domain-containing protein [Steroidobacteraceae bacterium]